MRLTKQSFIDLYMLFHRGYEVSYYPTEAAVRRRHMKLVKMGFAEDDMGRGFRISEDGLLRLLDPETLIAKRVMEK